MLSRRRPNGQCIDDVKISVDGSSCQPGDPANCDDSNPCTIDFCDPGSGCANTTPTAPSGASVSAVARTGENTFELSWSALPGATGYDLISGDLGVLRSPGGGFPLGTAPCLVNDFPGLTVDLFEDPVVGEGLWYLVRGANCGGNGTYDEGQPSQVNPRDPEITASGNDCP